MSHVETWIDSQKTLVQVGGIACANIKLEGTDGTVWGTWPIGTPNLALTIQQALIMLGEQLPQGRHPVKLLALDGQGNQIALLPQMISGKSQIASLAATESKALQQASAMALANMQTVNDALARENARLAERANDDLDTKLRMLDALIAQQHQNTDADLKQAEFAARQARMDKLVEALLPMASVFLEVVGSKMMGLTPPQAPGPQAAPHNPNPINPLPESPNHDRLPPASLS